MSSGTQSKTVIDDIENEFYELIGQISYGEISNISTYWHGLADALLKLDLKGWEKPESKNVSEILRSMIPYIAFNGQLTELGELASEMEGLSEERGSTGELDEEDLYKLQSLAEDFESVFVSFLNNLRLAYVK